MVVGPLVVGAVVVVGAVLVVVAPDVATVDVGASEVVLDALVPVDADELSLEVELEKVVPIVIGETSPSAPDTSRPSTKTAPIPTKTLI